MILESNLWIRPSFMINFYDSMILWYILYLYQFFFRGNSFGQKTHGVRDPAKKLRFLVRKGGWEEDLLSWKQKNWYAITTTRSVQTSTNRKTTNKKRSRDRHWKFCWIAGFSSSFVVNHQSSAAKKQFPQVMNMIGAVKHVDKALEAGVDIICAQGGEGGGHTGPRETSGLMAVSDKPVSWGEGSGFRPMIYRVFIHIYSGNLIPSTPFSLMVQWKTYPKNERKLLVTQWPSFHWTMSMGGGI